MKLEDVERNYDRIARRYDAWTAFLFGTVLGIEALREHVVDMLGDVDGKTVLDIGCGTGRNFALLHSRVGRAGRVVGLDYSEGMLNTARELIEREGWTNIEVVRGDAAKLERVREPVDAALSTWCMGIVDDLQSALRRMVEVVRPGGRIAILDFDRARPDRGLLRSLYPLYSAVLKHTGIDAAEDVDDAQLRAKWGAARPVLESRLEGLLEERYLQGMGIILSGVVPHSEVRP